MKKRTPTSKSPTQVISVDSSKSPKEKNKTSNNTIKDSIMNHPYFRIIIAFFGILKIKKEIKKLIIIKKKKKVLIFFMDIMAFYKKIYIALIE